VSTQPATKQDLADAVRQVTEMSSQKLDAAVQQVSEKLTEAIRDSETEVLRAFCEWSRPVEVRLRAADDLGRRMSWLEERISELERGKLPPTH
jgi:nucleoid DNA-binding protein